MDTNSSLLERARASAYRIMRSDDGKRPVPVKLAKSAATVIARHWLKIDAISISVDDRLTVSADAREKAKWAAKRIEWMRNPDRQHGQQAKEYGEKTIRGLSNGSLSATQLFARCEEFGRLRKMHIDRNSAKKPRADERSLEIPSCGMTARWLVSDKQINEIGQSMSNCLANKEFAKDYKARLRSSSVELIAIENEDGDSEALISIDSMDNSVEYVKGRENGRAIQSREAIISVLTHRGVSVGECPDLLSLGICDGLLAARARQTSETYIIGKRECEIGVGFLVILQDGLTILIRSDGCHSWGSDICVVSPDGDETNYLSQAAARVWIRNVCRKNSDFADSCWAAFEDAPNVFCLDWFGVRQPTTST